MKFGSEKQLFSIVKQVQTWGILIDLLPIKILLLLAYCMEGQVTKKIDIIPIILSLWSFESWRSCSVFKDKKNRYRKNRGAWGKYSKSWVHSWSHWCKKQPIRHQQFVWSTTAVCHNVDSTNFISTFLTFPESYLPIAFLSLLAWTFTHSIPKLICK